MLCSADLTVHERHGPLGQIYWMITIFLGGGEFWVARKQWKHGFGSRVFLVESVQMQLHIGVYATTRRLTPQWCVTADNAMQNVSFKSSQVGSICN